MIRVIAVLLMMTSMAQADAVQNWIDDQPKKYRWLLQEIATDKRLADLTRLCPADVFPPSGPKAAGSADCARNPNWCLAKCRAGQAKACFGVARAIQTEMDDPGEATFTFPMFMAACERGHANGCTNAGAAAKNGSWIPGTQPLAAVQRPCQFRTYQAACGAGATWGCYMLGTEWGVEGVNGQIDREKAREAWRRSCALAPDGSACAASERQLSADP